LNGDGTVNVADVQIAVNEALGLSPCTMNLDGTGTCDVADVQRVIAAALGGTCVVTSAASSTITLPVEVMGPNGTTTPVSFSIPAASSSLLGGTQTLSLQVHGLKYETEASVQVNNSSWIPINSSTVTLQGLAGAYGGIGGGYHTLSMTMSLPAGTVVTGNNTVTFKFNATDGATSGYRVLAVNVIGSDGSSQLVPSSAFVWDNPNNWQPPLNDASDIATGQTLYTTATLTVPLTSGGTSTIKAHCADCHTQNGRDLKYFNYSNNSIVVRSQFHGLTAQQGNQIASFIRSLSYPNPGRPWNPPYQPGPGLDSLPVSAWSAGAGLGAVLSSDLAMLPYVAPTMTAADFSANGNFNARETPIAIQLPDWNGWLPRIHPIDAWGTAFTQDATYNDYLSLRANLVPNSATTYSQQSGNIASWTTDRYDFQSARTPAQSDSSWSNPTTGTQLYSIGQWQTVKMWEINQDFGLEDMAQSVFGPQSDTRAWFTNTPFFTAPSIMKMPPGAAGILNGSIASFYDISYVWYYLQMILDDSEKTQQCGSSPLDWGYFDASSTNLSENDSPSQSMIYFGMLTKGLQISQNGVGPEHGCSGGWNWRNSTPEGLVQRENTFFWNGVPSATRATLINSYVTSWFAVISSFTPQQFYAGGWTTASEPVTPGFAAANFASNMAFIIPHLKYWGLNSALAQAIEQWAATMWPSNGYNWAQTTTATCSTDSQGYAHCSTDN